MTWVIRSSVFCSSPLARLTIGIHGWIHSLAFWIVVRIAVLGTPTMSSSAWRIAFSRSSVAMSCSGSWKPGRYASLVCWPSISAAVSALRAHSTVGWRVASSAAVVVPHEPAPSTVTCMPETVVTSFCRLGSARIGWY